MNELLTRILTSLVLILTFLITFFWLPPVILSMLLSVILVYILIFEWPQLCTKNIWLLTPLYPIVPFIIMIYFNHSARKLLLLLVFMVACFDSFSYLVGKKIGRHKIAPHISPGKTWEGVLGGYIMTAIFFYFLVCPKIMVGIIIPLLLCSLALVGDLFESWLKRRAGIKDTANILPGHGGFLDRFDGAMFAAMGIYFLRSWF